MRRIYQTMKYEFSLHSLCTKLLNNYIVSNYNIFPFSLKSDFRTPTQSLRSFYVATTQRLRRGYAVLRSSYAAVTKQLRSGYEAAIQCTQLLRGKLWLGTSRILLFTRRAGKAIGRSQYSINNNIFNFILKLVHSHTMFKNI